MSTISPALTASSSVTAFDPISQSSRSSQSSQPSNKDDVMQTGDTITSDDNGNVQDFTDLFDFDHFEESYASSHSHSPTTISPNHTPSPYSLHAEPYAISPSFDFLKMVSEDNSGFHNGDHDGFNFDFAMNEKQPIQPYPQQQLQQQLQEDQPQQAQQQRVSPPFDVKQEPFEFGFQDMSQDQVFDFGADQQSQPAPIQQVQQFQPVHQQQVQQQAQPTQQAFQGQESMPVPDFGNLPIEQQMALQQLLTNMINYQQRYGAELGQIIAQETAPTRQEAMSTTIQPSMLFNQNAPSTISPTVSVNRGSMSTTPSDEESLAAIEPHEQPISTSNSTSSAPPNQDIDSKIDALVPLPQIFSTGRGKGGKKGGGMSSVVRGEDEDLDDDDSWRPSPEEYKKLSSKEKRQLRNKLSARAFRNRRKDYIGTLEAHIKDRDTVIDAMRSELVTSRTENQDLRRELEALKTSTMSILHPESASAVSESPATLSALAIPLAVPAEAGPGPSTQQNRRAPTPKYNPRKDLPSSYDAKNGFWGGSIGGGSTICHPMFTPDLVLPAESKPSPLRSIQDLPRININPRLNDETPAPRMPALASDANGKELGGTFSEWSESNPFTLRSMDSYRMQLWSRLARDAAAERTNVPHDVRPKFYVEPPQVAAAVTSHVTSKLASSFWSAFSSQTAGRLDTDKLAAVVTGTARLKVVDNHPSPSSERDEADGLVAALSGLKLQSGITNREGSGLRVRENPLAAIGNFFTSAMPARA